MSIFKFQKLEWMQDNVTHEAFLLRNVKNEHYFVTFSSNFLKGLYFSSSSLIRSVGAHFLLLSFVWTNRKLTFFATQTSSYQTDQPPFHWLQAFDVVLSSVYPLVTNFFFYDELLGCLKTHLSGKNRINFQPLIQSFPFLYSLFQLHCVE